MGFFNKKLSFNVLKDAVSEAAAKVSETVQNADVASKVAVMKASVSDTAAQVTGKLKTIDIASTLAATKETMVEASGRTIEATLAVYESTRDKASLVYESAADEVRNFDYAQLKDVEFYQDKFQHYKDLSEEKVSEYFRSTFEIDKSTMQMVDDIRNKLPVPTHTVDDIFAQCKTEAIRRAVVSFGLAGIVQNLDQSGADKYKNLSETYQEFKNRSPGLSTHENYAAMNNIRAEARIKDGTLATLENGYNKNTPLLAVDADVEHVIAKKTYFDDILIRIGTTDDGMTNAINSKENLVFADASFNRSLGEKDLLAHIDKVGREEGDIVWVKIESTGKEVALSKKDIQEAHERADAQRNAQRLDAAVEVASTVIKTGATMAAQQIVGLIVLETVDIFVDELRDFASKGKLINADGWRSNTKEATIRIRLRLEQPEGVKLFETVFANSLEGNFSFGLGS